MDAYRFAIQRGKVHAVDPYLIAAKMPRFFIQFYFFVYEPELAVCGVKPRYLTVMQYFRLLLHNLPSGSRS